MCIMKKVLFSSFSLFALVEIHNTDDSAIQMLIFQIPTVQLFGRLTIRISGYQSDNLEMYLAVLDENKPCLDLNSRLNN